MDHALDELPQVLNPASGFVQNCNSSPFTTTSGSNLEPKDFPAYMIGPFNTDTPKTTVARRILSRNPRATESRSCAVS
jgi:acyl-homoserine-lactone acylase